jgi:acetyl esterase/lipase
MRGRLILIGILASCGGDALKADAGAGDAAALEATPIVETCAAPPDAGVTEQLDLPYAQMGGQQLYVDLVGPTAPGLHPLIIMVHGGGWALGSRKELLGIARGFAAQGYVAASVEYRLVSGTTNQFPAAIQDLRCASRWLRANAGAVIDPTRVGLFGASAGGHLVSLLATTPDETSFDGACPVAGPLLPISAVASLAGPQDLRDLQLYGAGENADARQFVRGLLGADPATIPAAASLASPITHVTASAPPFLLVHGTADPLVHIEVPRAMRDALHGVGGRATLYEAQGAGHGAGFTDAQNQTIACTLAAFFAAFLSPSG